MAAMFSPPADAGPSPPSTKAVRASTAAQHLAAGEHARAVWVQLSAGGPLTEETFVQVHARCPDAVRGPESFTDYMAPCCHACM